jgi:hypothetical protein
MAGFPGNVSISVSNDRLAALLGRGQEMTDFDRRLNDKYFNKLADWGCI